MPLAVEALDTRLPGAEIFRRAGAGRHRAGDLGAHHHELALVFGGEAGNLGHARGIGGGLDHQRIEFGVRRGEEGFGIVGYVGFVDPLGAAGAHGLIEIGLVGGLDPRFCRSGIGYGRGGLGLGGHDKAGSRKRGEGNEGFHATGSPKGMSGPPCAGSPCHLR